MRISQIRKSDHQNHFVLNYFDQILSLVAALTRWKIRDQKNPKGST
jgi:hypothetical protein